MPRKKRPKRRRPETLMRFIDITSVSARVSVSAGQERGGEPEIHSTGSIELTGTMDEPMRDTRDVEISLYSADNPKPGAGPPPWLGYVHGIRPTLRPVIFVAHREFDRCVGVGRFRPAKTRSHGVDGPALSVGRCAQRVVLNAPGGIIERSTHTTPSRSRRPFCELPLTLTRA